MLKLAGKYHFKRRLLFKFVENIYNNADKNIIYKALAEINKEIDFKNRLILDLNKKNAGNKYYTIIGDLYKMPFIYVISLKDFMKRGKMYAKILVYEDIPF